MSISIDNIVTFDENWNDNYLIDKIFNDLMDGQKGNKYIKQFIDAFPYFRIKSPNVFFQILIKDLDKDTTVAQLERCIKDCETADEKRIRLDGIFTEVIALVAKQTQPMILSSVKYEDIEYVKKALNEIRESVSLKWNLVNDIK